jgi:hypothetical protein
VKTGDGDILKRDEMGMGRMKFHPRECIQHRERHNIKLYIYIKEFGIQIP